MAPKAHITILLLSPGPFTWRHGKPPVFIYLLLSTYLPWTERNLFSPDPLKTSCQTAAVGTTQRGQKGLDKGEQKQEACSSNVLMRPCFVHHVLRHFEELWEALMRFDEELMPHNYGKSDFILDVILPNNPSRNMAVMCLLILCSFVPSGVPKTTLRHKNNYLHTVPMTKKGSVFLGLLTDY